MFELVLRAPEALVEPVSDALIDELGALSVSVEDADADTDAEQALFGEPGMPAPRRRLAALDAARRCSPTRPRPPRPPRCCWRRTGPTACSCSRCSRVADQDWVRLTQSQFAPVAITPGFWIVPSWHEPPAGAQQRDPARPGPGLRHRHPPDHAHVPALDGRAGRRRWPRLARACSTTAAARASWPSARRCTAPRDIDAVDIDPAAVQATAANAAANGVTLQRRPARAGAGPLPAGAGQHPGHAAEAAGAAAVRPRGSRRPPGAGRHPGAPGRRAEGGLRALAGAAGQRPARTAGS